MKLLYFAPHQIWPLNTGARLRDYQLARQLAARASVTFVEMCHGGEEKCMPPDDSGLARVVTLDKNRTYTLSKILRGLAGPTPLTVLNCWSLQSASQFANVLKSHQFDTVQIEGTQLMAYLSVVQESPGSPGDRGRLAQYRIRDDVALCRNHRQLGEEDRGQTDSETDRVRRRPSARHLWPRTQ